ncbi:LINE-1 retrotransposable element ORF2 protein [Vitis vinifera]|uniref:LINE-1 retrotransposable element ORF2 protein n=1 Tax=Vitis vinifera TaxID=29760 RepID=A0A438J7A7_VITVI|nr:LINE-1 retrotransposable element ORF2 protein [Vitis vinifera]
MSEGVVRSLGSGRFLDWGAMDAHGSAGGILICWDKRTLEVLEMEVGHFSISCRLRNVEDVLVWIFTGVYWQFSREDREALWEELGAIRGIWNDPWLSRPTSDHFPILLKGGRLRRGPSPFRFENMWLKVDGFKDLLRGWWQGSEDVFGRLEVNKNSALQQVEFWDRVESERSLSEREMEMKKEAKETFKKWVLLEETHWRQVSRELWLKEGDKNRGFFHRMANAHRRNNSLDRIKINGVWRIEEQKVREGIVNAFQQLLSEEPGWKADIEGLHLQSLNSSEAKGLELPFTEEEIHSALLEMNGDKAPGPDGFIVAFWQFCWDFVKEEIVDLFKEFYEQRSFAKSLNTTFLILIPKKGGAKDLGDYRSISLLGGLYKLLAKVLANRLKKVLGKVISVDQNAFVRDRQILDASLIANEVIDFWHKRKEKGLICKLDIEKAYDSINWNFLMKVLHKMGFGSRWMEWIWWCISTAKFSVLVNGVPTGFFSNSKGLHQGDPLSPYLFVLGMEVLSALIRRAVVGGFISSCSLQGRGRMKMDVSHLLFADDTIIFCEARKEFLTSLSWILAWFEAASGLRINLAKSELIPIGEVEEIEEMTMELGCKVRTLPSVYLGLPLGAHHKATSMWDGVEERMRRRLALWKRQYISKGLVGKWIWRFAFEKDILWKKVIGVKYGQEGFGWRTNEAHGAFGVGVWKEILKEANWCWDNMMFNVGEGTKVKFWIDHWCGALFNMLRDFKISQEEDSVLWKGGGQGTFGVREAYNLLVIPNALAVPLDAFGWTRSHLKLLFLLGGYVGEDPHLG